MHIIHLCISQIACLEGRTGSDQPEESCSPAGESQPSSPTSGSSERNGLSTDDPHSGTEELGHRLFCIKAGQIYRTSCNILLYLFG